MRIHPSFAALNPIIRSTGNGCNPICESLQLGRINIAPLLPQDVGVLKTSRFSGENRRSKNLLTCAPLESRGAAII
jgi:hypothetical protein